MNLTDNGVKEVLNIDKVITDTKMYFLVTFIDWYGCEREKRFSDITNIDKKCWKE